MFAEGSLPERGSLVLKKGPIFGEVFAEGSPPERNSQVLRYVVKKVKILKVLRMGLPIVENLSGLHESIFSLSRRPQLHFGKQ